MATVTKIDLMTAEEFMAADLGDGTFELVRGEVVEMALPMPEHGRVQINVALVLEMYGRQTGYGYCLGESAVLTERGPDTVRGPDVSFYSHARWPRASVGKAFPPVSPDVVVEVYSPGNRTGQMNKKISEYLLAGTFMVWVIYLDERRVVLHHSDDRAPVVLQEGDAIENLPELPGFHCAVADFFV
jgi:Uma2 family endonuclease